MILAEKIILRLLVIFLCLLMSACSQKALRFHRLADLPNSKICRLAVLPFTSETGTSTTSAMLYRIFMAELAELDNFEIVQEGDIRQAFRQLRMIPFSKKADIIELQVLGNYLNVQYLIEGTVLEMLEYKQAGTQLTLPSLTMELRLIDAANGRTLWKSYHRKSGNDYRKVMHFGLVNTKTQLASLMSKEILERWASEGFKAQCED